MKRTEILPRTAPTELIIRCWLQIKAHRQQKDSSIPINWYFGIATHVRVLYVRELIALFSRKVHA
jgi:hypothetical protein